MKKAVVCRGCGKNKGVKYFIIADDMENPRPYHQKCVEKMLLEAFMRLALETPKKKKKS